MTNIHAMKEEELDRAWSEYEEGLQNGSSRERELMKLLHSLSSLVGQYFSQQKGLV